MTTTIRTQVGQTPIERRVIEIGAQGKRTWNSDNQDQLQACLSYYTEMCSLNEQLIRKFSRFRTLYFRLEANDSTVKERVRKRLVDLRFLIMITDSQSGSCIDWLTEQNSVNRPMREPLRRCG